jgi:hypothetical protein
LIEAFQGEKVVNVPLHAKDVNVEGGGITYHLHQGHKTRMKRCNHKSNMQDFQDWNVNIHGKRTVNGVNIFEDSIKPLPNNDQQPFIVTFVNMPPTLVGSNIKVQRKYNFFSIH